MGIDYRLPQRISFLTAMANIGKMLLPFVSLNGLKNSQYMKLKSRLNLLHPLLAAVYPILALLAHNLGETPLSAGWRSLAISLAASIIVWLFLGFIFKDITKAAILTTICLVAFFTYGHLRIIWQDPWMLLGLPLNSHRYLLPFFALSVMAAFWLLKAQVSSAKIREINNLLTFLGIALVGLAVYQTARFQIEASRQNPSVRPLSGSALPTGTTANMPDIYVIVFDMYTREDFMLKELNFDNSFFLDQLRWKGFGIADCARSNYSVTIFTLASMLNMNYLEDLLPDLDTNTAHPSAATPLIQESLVANSLMDMGYKSVAFQTDYPATELHNATYYFSANTVLDNLHQLYVEHEGDENTPGSPSAADEPGLNWLGLFRLNEFELMLMQTTAASFVPELVTKTSGDTGQAGTSINELRRYWLVRLMLDEIEQAIEIEGPKFVFLHLVSPHSPFVFDLLGNFAIQEDSDTAGNFNNLGYTDQVQYINKRILDLVDQILAHSDTDPVVIIMGDHGISQYEEAQSDGFRYSEILYAYHLPNGKHDYFYSTITPVNTFRIVFNELFGANYELLEDVSYRSTSSLPPFKYEPVPERFDNCRLLGE